MRIPVAMRVGFLLTLAALSVLVALDATTPTPQPSDPNLVYGKRFFDDAIRYVCRGQAAVSRVRDFHTRLVAEAELNTGHPEGQIRVWYDAPDLYRQEITANGVTTTKILNRETGWLRAPYGLVQNLASSEEGRRTVKRLEQDRARMSNIAQFLTLQPLKGSGVTFRFEGYTKGTGTYEGNWIKIIREAPGRANITFWLAWERDAQNNVRATWPGIVRVEGDPRQGIPAEDYILKEWGSRLSQQRTFRYPRRIEAYSLVQDRADRAVPTRFLYALVDDIKINAGIDPSRFQQPER